MVCGVNCTIQLSKKLESPSTQHKRYWLKLYYQSGRREYDLMILTQIISFRQGFTKPPYRLPCTLFLLIITMAFKKAAFVSFKWLMSHPNPSTPLHCLIGFSYKFCATERKLYMYYAVFTTHLLYRTPRSISQFACGMIHVKRNYNNIAFPNHPLLQFLKNL